MTESRLLPDPQEYAACNGPCARSRLENEDGAGHGRGTFRLRKELDHKRKFIGLPVAFLHRTDDGKDEPGDGYNRVKRHEE